MAGKITGLCFHKYPMTLSQKLKEATPFDTSSCLEGIGSGVRPMHSLGLIHNDLNPRSIMMDGERPVIIDFDSCKREGDELGIKAGTSGWAMEGIIYARPESDCFCLSKTREFMMGGEEGKPEGQS
jgi:serine/threonine protein kinase